MVMVLQRQRGSVLIVSMVVLVLISTMAARIVYQTRLELRIQQQVNVLTRLRALARGAAHQFASHLSTRVELSSNGPTLSWWVDQTAFAPITTESSEAIIIPGDSSTPNRTSKKTTVAVEDDTESEEGNSVEGLVDAESQLNINTATPEQLMAFPGFSNVLAEEIVRYREALGNEAREKEKNRTELVDRGATASENGQQSLPQYVASPFRSVSELLQVDGMTEEILYEVIPDLNGAPANFMTCCSSGRINLNTAPHPVLVAAGFSPEEANMLVSERRGGAHFEDLSLQGTVLPEIDQERWERLSRTITVRSNTFLLTVVATNDASDQALTLVARVFLDEKAIRFVSWREI